MYIYIYIYVYIYIYIYAHDHREFPPELSSPSSPFFVAEAQAVNGLGIPNGSGIEEFCCAGSFASRV